MWKSKNNFSLLFSAFGCACGWSGLFCENRRSVIICTIMRFSKARTMLRKFVSFEGDEASENLIIDWVLLIIGRRCCWFCVLRTTQTNYGDFPNYSDHSDVALCQMGEVKVSSPLTLPQRKSWQDKNLFFGLFTLSSFYFQVGCAIVLLWLGINFVLTFCPSTERSITFYETQQTFSDLLRGSGAGKEGKATTECFACLSFFSLHHNLIIFGTSKGSRETL